MTVIELNNQLNIEKHILRGIQIQCGDKIEMPGVLGIYSENGIWYLYDTNDHGQIVILDQGTEDAMAQALYRRIIKIEKRQLRKYHAQTMFNIQNMQTKILNAAKEYQLDNTLIALDFATKAHKGQKRKNSNIPYLYHPLSLACHALSIGITDDNIIAASLLHDVVEDCNIQLEELPVNDQIKELVRLLTHEHTNDNNRDTIMAEYYRQIIQNPIASLIKCLDRCDNLTTMSWGLSYEHQKRVIKETKKYYPMLYQTIESSPQYHNIAWILQYQIESMINIYDTLL